MPTARSQFLTLFGFVVVSLGVGAVAGSITAPAIPSWYAGLVKPPFNPPDTIFAPVWSALYVLMAVSAWRVWLKTGFKCREMALYAVQLTLNFAWSFIFFGAHALVAALIELVVLLAFIVVTMLSFWRKDRIAGALFVPYAAWVSFAGVLNAALWRLNG